MRPFVDLGTGSFSFLAWSQITNEAAVSAYMSNGRITAPVTFHLLHGVRGGGAAQHSHSPQSMMCNAPGLEIVAPSNAADAYGLVRAAFASPNPTVIINHAKLLGLESEMVGKPEVPIGRADVKRRGRDVTIVANSLMTHYSLAAADKLARRRHRGGGRGSAHHHAARRAHHPGFGRAGPDGWWWSTNARSAAASPRKSPPAWRSTASTRSRRRSSG